MKYHLVIALFSTLILAQCDQLPAEKLSQSGGKIVEYEVVDDTLRISINNHLKCPIRVNATTTDETTQTLIAVDLPITMSALQDTQLYYPTNLSKKELAMKFSAVMGDPRDTLIKEPILLPFKKGRKYKVIQGYNGSFSHNSEYSRYALDFNLPVGDTICAAADGVVVGVIEGYTDGGKSKKWRDYANFITIFHPDMNLYTQYVHLVHDGSFIEVGDSVMAGQDIGLSGETGFTASEHLHFNVLRPNEKSMQSEPISFKEGYTGSELKKGTWVER